MKTLMNEINEIKNSNVSYATKRENLLKLGLRPQEISLVLSPDERITFTFGVELETVGVDQCAAIIQARNLGLSLVREGYNHVDSAVNFRFVPDGSLTGTAPIECVTPVLSGAKGLKGLKNICDVINGNGGGVNASCGTHVHIGVKNITDDWYINVFKNYQMLEGLIDTFMANSRRENNCRWCKSIHAFDFSRANAISDIAYIMNDDRYHKVNPMSWARHKTIEFRQHQGTTNYEKISNWVKFCGKLVVWSKKNRLTDYVNDINDVPFLSAQEKSFFAGRISELN